MKVLVQWTRRNPQDWQELDSSAWSGLAKLPDPTVGQLGGQDNTIGWIFGLNVQGIMMDGADHYAIEDLPDGGLRVSRWFDDPDNLSLGESAHGQVWTFHPPAHDPFLHGRLIDKLRESFSARLQSSVVLNHRVVSQESEVVAADAINTQQSVIVYTDQPDLHGGWGEVRPWSQFPLPLEGITRHGIWVTDALARRHSDVRADRGWREWVAGQVDGEPQFVPHGTITYFGSNTAQAVGWVAGIKENQALTVTSGAATITDTVPLSTTNRYSYVWTTNAGEPNSADWPSGVFNIQIDVSAIGADLTVGGSFASGTNGQLSRVSSDGATSQEARTNGTTSSGGTGVKLFTSGTFDATAGSAGDRYGQAIQVHNSSSMKNEDITIQNVNTATCYLDGPWTPAAVVNPQKSIIVGQAHQRAAVR